MCLFCFYNSANATITPPAVPGYHHLLLGNQVDILGSPLASPDPVYMVTSNGRIIFDGIVAWSHLLFIHLYFVNKLLSLELDVCKNLNKNTILK